MRFQSLNPTTGALLAYSKRHTAAEIEGILHRANTTYQSWSKRLMRTRQSADKLVLIATQSF